jgi:hypothetical protein
MTHHSCNLPVENCPDCTDAERAPVELFICPDCRSNTHGQCQGSCDCGC